MDVKKLISRFSLAVVMLSILSVTGCSTKEIPDIFVPEKESELAKSILTELRNKNLKYVQDLLSEDLKVSANEERLLEVSNYFHSGEPVSVEVIGSQVQLFNNRWAGTFTFEYEFSDGWNVANVGLSRIDDTYTIISLHVYQSEGSQQEINKFTLQGKSIIHYALLALAILVPLFIIVTLVSLVRTPMKKRKWLWFLFILLGFGTLHLNWTTGALQFQVLHVQLLGASMTAFGKFAPWIVSASVPFGAIVFWVRRSEFIEENADNNVTE